MKALKTIGKLAGGTAALWCLALVPRRGHTGWEKLAGFRYAHRGLHDVKLEAPENSLAAFRRAVDRGFGAELDVHLLADGELAVVHDSDLARVCGKSVCVEDLTAADLKDYHLQGTSEHIPLFREVLAVFEKKTPLIIELKVARGNAEALTDRVMEQLADWDGTYCIESFHPAVLRHLRERYPEVIRGQLSENFMRDSQVGDLPKVEAAAATLLLTTTMTRPDFIAYRWEDRACPSLQLMRKLYGVHEVSWTIRDKETLERLEADGVTPIFENFIP